MPTCPVCGHSLDPDQRFCSHCGAPLNLSSSETKITTPTPPADDTARQAGRASDGGQLLPGTILAGRYRMIGLLGRGGMGEVYRADDLKLGQPVALKFLPRHVESQPDRLERFLTEVRLSLRVTHPNVCRVHDIGQADGRHFLSMEYVDGEDLASLLRRIGRLPEDKAVEIARQLCAGLEAAHAEGVLHRDLKPANVMLDGRGRARLTDFGLAGATEGVAGAEARSGTPQYMAPEQLTGDALSKQTDLYSLGLVLYELFTGKRAYEAGRIAELMRLQQSTPTSPSAHGVFILTRWGLFAMLTAIVFSSWRSFPLTLDTSSWYFSWSVTTMALFAGVAVYGFVVSLGGQALFKGSLFDLDRP